MKLERHSPRRPRTCRKGAESLLKEQYDWLNRIAISLQTEAKRLYVAPYVPSPPQVIRQMLLMAVLKPGEVFFDLGAGDGRTVIMAAKDFGARAVGVELREDLVKKALGTVYEEGLQDRIEVLPVRARPAGVVGDRECAGRSDQVEQSRRVGGIIVHAKDASLISREVHVSVAESAPDDRR